MTVLTSTLFLIALGDFLMFGSFEIAESGSGSYRHLAILRWSLVVVFVWFGAEKFTSYAAEGIAPLVAKQPDSKLASILRRPRRGTHHWNNRIGDSRGAQCGGFSSDLVCFGISHVLRDIPRHHVILSNDAGR